MKKVWLYVVGMALLGGPQSLEAQVLARVNLQSSYTDNLFQSSIKRSDWVNLLYVDLDYTLAERLGLYYTGNASVFSDNTDLFNHGHSIGVDYVGSGLSLGGGVGARLDQPVYEYRDFVSANAYIESKRYLRPTLLWRGGYRLQVQEYLNADTYSFTDQVAYGRLSFFLPSRTTVDLRSEVGVKSYLRGVGEEEIAGLAARSGKGRHLVQWVGRLKGAQSLGASTGVQLEYSRRQNIAGQSRYVLGEIYNPEDDLFDDRYSYTGDRVASTVKHLGIWSTEWSLRGSLERRHYSGRPALDLDGFLLADGQTRRDDRKSVSLSLGRTFFPLEGLLGQLDARLQWSYRHIDSNDPYYTAGTNTYLTSLRFTF